MPPILASGSYASIKRRLGIGDAGIPRVSKYGQAHSAPGRARHRQIPDKGTATPMLSACKFDRVALKRDEVRTRCNLASKGSQINEMSIGSNASGPCGLKFPPRLTDSPSVPIPPVVRIAGHHRHADLMNAGCLGPIKALLIQDEPDIDHAILARKTPDHFLSVCHLRHALRVNEAGHFKAPDPRVNGTTNKLVLVAVGRISGSSGDRRADRPR
jgi:hypothetical protein